MMMSKISAVLLGYIGIATTTVLIYVPQIHEGFADVVIQT